MTKYTLVYFNGRGRGEIVRQIFALAGQEFEDYRLKEGEWPTVKPSAPFGQAPFLKIDGEVALCQSLTIARFLARKFGFAGKTEMDQAKVDMIVDCAEDFIKPLLSVFFSSDEEAKAAGMKKFKEEQMPAGLEKFEKLLADSKSGFFVGDEITWCDLHFNCMLYFLESANLEPGLEKYANVKALKDKVDGNERIKAWLAKRPDSKF